MHLKCARELSIAVNAHCCFFSPLHKVHGSSLQWTQAEILFSVTKQATASGHIAFSIGFALMLYV